MKYVPVLAAAYTLLGTATACNSQNASSKEKEKPTTAPAAHSAAPPNVKGDTAFVLAPDGLDYKIVTKGAGTVTGKPGDYAEMHVRFSIGDSVMINTFDMNDGKPVPQQLVAPTMKGDLMEGLMRMHEGDSIVFRMLTDTMAARTRQTMPSWVKPGDYAVWEIKMVGVKTKAQMDAEAKQRDAAQLAKEDKTIQGYLAKNKITNARKTASGMYYVVHTPGSGVSPKAGQKVTVNYTGQTLKGEKFDSNTDPAFGHVQPFTFDLGKGSVIKGWDQGVPLMKKGMKATFYMPSPLAYGAHGSGPKIGPNEILIFDIELLSF
ncbi:MAG: FKBP-type peptidyl-prolyl cis-trans isomerase [Edaphocola sp.]